VRKNMTYITGLTVLLILIIILPLAASDENIDEEGSFGINLVYPPGETPYSYFWYDLAPGGSQRHEIDLFNNMKTPVKVLIYPADCYNTLDGTLAGPLLDGEKSKEVGTWVKVDIGEVELAPGKKKRVGFSLTVPPDTKPGDYFGFVFVQPSPIMSSKEKQEKTAKQEKPAEASFTVKLQQRLGVCLVVRVPGEHKSSIDITSIQKTIDPRGQLLLSVNLENSGNLYLKPKGYWELKNSAGETILFQDTTELGYLLPRFPVQIKVPIITSRPLASGEYELSVTVNYDNQKTEKKFKVQLP